MVKICGRTVAGQYLSVHSAESETSGLFSPRFIVSGPSDRLSRGKHLNQFGLSARPRDILRFKSCANFEGSVPCFHRAVPHSSSLLALRPFCDPVFPNRSRIDERNDAVDARQKGGLHNPRVRHAFSLVRRHILLTYIAAPSAD